MNCRKKQVEQIKCKECLGCKPNQDVWACWVGCYSMVNFSWLSSLIYWPLQKKVNGMGGCCPVVSQLQACPAHRWFGHPLPSTQTAGSGGDPVLQSLSCSASGFAAKNHVCTGTSSVAGAAVGTALAPWLAGSRSPTILTKYLQGRQCQPRPYCTWAPRLLPVSKWAEGPSPQCSVFCYPIPGLTSFLCPGDGTLTCSLNGLPCQQLLLHLHRAGGTPGRKTARAQTQAGSRHLPSHVAASTYLRLGLRPLNVHVVSRPQEYLKPQALAQCLPGPLCSQCAYSTLKNHHPAVNNWG